MSVLRVSVKSETHELKEPFTISRGTRTHIDVIYVEITDGTHTGRGESCPTKRYGETQASLIAQINELKENIHNGLTPTSLQSLMPYGAARSAVDSALWDYMAKQTGKRVWELVGLPAPKPIETVFTISLDTPEKMAVSAKKHSARGLLKLKFGGDEDDLKIAAIREAVGENCRLILDANEAWTPDHLKDFLPVMARYNVLMVEQPLKQGFEEALGEVEHLVPVCADESCHTRKDLKDLKGLYEMINIKLDKTGGLTEATALYYEAVENGFEVMVGCMLGTSLGVAASHLVASVAKFVDLDAPLLVAKDCVPGLKFEGALVYPPSREFWG